MTETWVEGHQLDLWNHFENQGARTTNNVEGWHSKVNKLCTHAQPNIFSIVQLLQKLQATNEAKLIQLVGVGKKRAKRRRYRQIDSCLAQLKYRFQNGLINEYAGAASDLLHLE